MQARLQLSARIGALAALFAIGVYGDKALAADIQIKIGHDMPEFSPHHKAVVRWKELVEEHSNGKVEVMIFPASILGSATQMVEQVQAGALEAAMLPNAQIAPIAPELTVLDLPYLFPNREIAHAVVDGPVGDTILAVLDKSNIIGLAHWESGFKQFTGNFPIAAPADYEGRKIRTMPSQVVQQQFQAFGAVPTQIAFSELYSSLQQGVVDGQENPIATIAAGKLYEVQPYITLSDHGFLGEVFMINKTFFEGLDPEIQTVLREAAWEGRDYQRQLIAENEQEQLEMFKKAGVNIIELTPEDREKFVAAAQQVHEWYRSQNGGELLDAIQADIKEREAGGN
ncbi:TRAP transporter substrate-binding protein [Defluviimonas sp. SAOS-178_SWC]|uniref:TRAP transporter substrate-binding protein n=1 Tax=Defluviimonas sp. SAOS-178_SWC TaxID=3121287 RepID=UPI00322216BF